MLPNPQRAWPRANVTQASCSFRACLVERVSLPGRERAGWEACATCQVRHGESVLWRTGSLSYFDYRDALTCLFQEEIHAIEIDYGMTDVQRVHSQNTTDSCTALPQGEMR